MKLKQSEQEYLDNLVKAEKKLLPSVLSQTPEGAESNGHLLGNWMRKNAKDGIIDVSVSNIIDGIVALDKAGLIAWQTPPVKKPAKPQPDFLQTHEGRAPNHAHEVRVSEVDIQMAQERKRRQQLGDVANGKLLSEAAALVRNHTNYPHARQLRERTALKREFDRLTAAKVHPEKVLAGVKALQNTFTGEDVTRPKIAGI